MSDLLRRHRVLIGVAAIGVALWLAFVLLFGDRGP